MTWRDCRNDVEEERGDIYAQRYCSDGMALGSNFKVNDDQGDNWQGSPSISSANSGNFVITWDDSRNESRDIYAQRYSSDGTALGSNFKVNDDEVDAAQYSPSISSDSNGNFVITWEDNRNGNSDIYAQRYLSDGTALGRNFRVNDDEGISDKLSPSISSDNSGNFIITWQDRRNRIYHLRDAGDIYAQRYSSDGTALESNFMVNDDELEVFQYSPSISSDDNGNFVITWEDGRNDYCRNIYAQRYSSDGIALGINFQVNDDVYECGHRSPSIVSDNSGNFVITWQDSRKFTWNIYAQCYLNDGTALGSNFQVNENDTIPISNYKWQSSPSISSDGSSNFVATWVEGHNNNDIYASDIYAQCYSSDGKALGSNFQVNDDKGWSDQRSPSIASDNSGNFVITWLDDRNAVEEERGDIYAQRYSSDGTALGCNFKVNDDQGYGSQSSPFIASDNSSNFIITWQDGRNVKSFTKNNRDIYAQRYSSDGTALGSNFKVNDDQGYGSQSSPSISSDNSGIFIITWQDGRNQGRDIYAQRYLSDGTALGSNFKVNDRQESVGYSPSISSDRNGNFVITWVDNRIDWRGDIYAQRYSSDGIALGSNFLVNDDLWDEMQDSPSISTDGSENFVITWIDGRNGDRDIYAQRYLSDGTTLGSNFKVNDRQESEGSSPSISSDNSGNFMITWVDRSNGNSIIYSQCYSSDGSTIGGNYGGTNWGSSPDVDLWNGRVYTTWTVNRCDGNGYNIWANVLDWNNLVGMSEKEISHIAFSYKLSQNYPNPYNPSTKIKFEIANPVSVKIEVYNIIGQKIQTLLNKPMPAGYHEVEFNAQNLSSGIYLYKIEAGEWSDVKKMILLR